MIAITLVLLVTLLHLAFMILEMFLWDKPTGQKIFKLDPVFLKKSKALAANQGLYNGFLSAGLIWSLAHQDAGIGSQLQFFFLSCVVVAGVFGGLTVSRTIIYVQSLPAVIALCALMLKI
jgi:putative membrane protein